MATGLYTEHLDVLEPEILPISYPAGMRRPEAEALAAGAPANQQILDACKAAYARHTPAVDQLTLGSIGTAQAPDMRPEISALHSYDWRRQVAAPGLVAPLFSSPTMAQARQAAFEDGAFLTFFLGIEANVDFIIGGAGGVGVGLPFPSLRPSPLWMAYGGLRIALNIDAAINLDAGIFVEPPSEVAGDYLGIDISAEPVLEGPSVSMGIHLSRDLSRVRGFSIGVGLELGVLPFTAAIVFGNIATNVVTGAPASAVGTGEAGSFSTQRNSNL